MALLDEIYEIQTDMVAGIQQDVGSGDLSIRRDLAGLEVAGYDNLRRPSLLL